MVMAATDLPSTIAEIKARVFANRIGAVTAVSLQQLLIDIVNVLDVIAIAAGTSAGATAGAAAGVQSGATAGAAAAVQFLTSQVEQVAAAAGAEAATQLVVGPAAAAYLAALPTALPAQSGQLWWDGGLLAMS